MSLISYFWRKVCDIEKRKYIFFITLDKIFISFHMSSKINEEENIHLHVYFYLEMYLARARALARHRLTLMYICCHRTIITIQFHCDNLLVA